MVFLGLAATFLSLFGIFNSRRRHRKISGLSTLKKSKTRTPWHSIYILVPGTTSEFRCGGLKIALETARIIRSCALCVNVVTYRKREDGFLFLNDLLEGGTNVHSLFVVCWGFHVPELLARLGKKPSAYHAHSTGYGFSLSQATPVFAVSRNTLGYWGGLAPRNPLFLTPNLVAAEYLERGARKSILGRRPIDVLVHKRKTSEYVISQLVPSLIQAGLVVKVQEVFVEDQVALYNRWGLNFLFLMCGNLIIFFQREGLHI